MIPSQPPHEHDRVQAHEHDRRDRVAAQEPRALPHEQDRSQAREREHALQRPERRRDAEWHHRERQEREQRPVGAEQLMPVAEVVARVGVRLENRDRGVGIEVVHDLHTPVVDVVEDVRQRQRRGEEEDRVHGDDRADRPAGSQPGDVAQPQQVGAVHDDYRPREQPPQGRPVARQPRPQPTQRTGHPAREVAAVRGRREQARPVRRRDEHERAADDDRDQRQRAQPRVPAGRPRGRLGPPVRPAARLAYESPLESGLSKSRVHRPRGLLTSRAQARSTGRLRPWGPCRPAPGRRRPSSPPATSGNPRR